MDASHPELSVPLYLHPNDPTSRPMMSHHAASHNVVFKITVPKRTGRKRKRGTNDPFQGDVGMNEADPNSSSQPEVCSRSKIDDPKLLRRKLQDNVGKYHVEPVGIIAHTHRYRGIADFGYSMRDSPFMADFSDKVLSGDISKFRQFSLKDSTDTSPNVDIIPPPMLTQINVPFTYSYEQNPYVKVVDNPDGSLRVINVTSRVKSVGYFIGQDDETPLAPTNKPRVRDANFDLVIREMEKAMVERPVWTRRALINKIGNAVIDPDNPEKRLSAAISQQLIRTAIQYVGYQFKGGPFRDALVKYGFDPRKDPANRIYQTMIFRLRRMEVGQMGEMWQDIRKRDLKHTKSSLDVHTSDSHMFDGKSYSENGKIWQVCDITDPLLARLLSEAPIRPECDNEASGWYHRGMWAKARAIMKCKIRAIQFGRNLEDKDFEPTLNMRDDSPDPELYRTIGVPLPDLKLTIEEMEQVRGKRFKNAPKKVKNKKTTYHLPPRIRTTTKASFTNGSGNTRASGHSQSEQQRGESNRPGSPEDGAPDNRDATQLLEDSLADGYDDGYDDVYGSEYDESSESDLDNGFYEEPHYAGQGERGFSSAEEHDSGADEEETGTLSI